MSKTKTSKPKTAMTREAATRIAIAAAKASKGVVPKKSFATRAQRVVAKRIVTPS